MKFKDHGHPFFRPLWRRAALTVFVGAWALYEALYVGDQLWVAGTAAMFGYAVWVYLITWPKDQGSRPPE